MWPCVALYETFAAIDRALRFWVLFSRHAQYDKKNYLLVVWNDVHGKSCQSFHRSSVRSKFEVDEKLG
jgi:hypothetical protein